MGCKNSKNNSNIDIKMKTNPATTVDDYSYPTIEELKSYNITKMKTYVPDITHGFVSKVYDGDTITVYCYNNDIKKNNNKLYKYSIRLSNIDCPELRTKNETEKLYAQRVQVFLSELILHKFIFIKIIKFEKYGRLLADIYLEKNNNIPNSMKKYKIDIKMSISDLLLRMKYAVVYDGGTKTQFNKNLYAPL